MLSSRQHVSWTQQVCKDPRGSLAEGLGPQLSADQQAAGVMCQRRYAKLSEAALQVVMG